MIMTKTATHSHFEVISSTELPKFGDRVIAICPEKLHNNTAGYAVFLCEVLDEEGKE